MRDYETQREQFGNERNFHEEYLELKQREVEEIGELFSCLYSLINRDKMITKFFNICQRSKRTKEGKVKWREGKTKLMTYLDYIEETINWHNHNIPLGNKRKLEVLRAFNPKKFASRCFVVQENFTYKEIDFSNE